MLAAFHRFNKCLRRSELHMNCKNRRPLFPEHIHLTGHLLIRRNGAVQASSDYNNADSMSR